jgi:hypothetical protein
MTDSAAMETNMDERTRKRPSDHLVIPQMAKHSRSLESIPGIQTNNNYDLLDEDNTPRMPCSTPIAGTSAAVAKVKRERVPTITIKWAIPRVRSELLLATIDKANFLLKQVDIGTVVKISNLKDYNQFLKRCSERMVPHFTHAVDAKKPLRIVLLGLPNWTVEEVKTALAEVNITPEDIKPMKIRKSRYIEHNNFILYFPKGSIAINHLRETKAIDNVIVRWTYYDSKRHGPTQCRRCQMWGHGSSNCHLNPACVKCAGAHETSACPVSTNGVKVPDEQLKCANCQQKHSANYGGCISRQNYITSRPKKKAPKKVNIRGGQPNFSQRYPAPSQQSQHWPPLQQQHQQQQRQQQQFHSQPQYVSFRDQVAGIKNLNFINRRNYSSQPNPSINVNNDINSHLDPQEAFKIFQEILPICNNGKPRSEQILMVIELALSYSSLFSNGSP